MEKVLLDAVTRLKSLDYVIRDHGYVIDTTLLAVRYLAEATDEDETQHMRLASARRAYEEALGQIDGVNKLRWLRD